MNELDEEKTMDSETAENAETDVNNSPAEEDSSKAEEDIQETEEGSDEASESVSEQTDDSNTDEGDDGSEAEDTASDEPNQTTESTDENEEPQEDDEAENPRSLLSKIGNGILIAGLVLITAFTAYVMVNAGRGKAVSLFGNYVLRVTTGSMEPSIHVGDYIIVHKTSVDKLKKDDVISFYSEESRIKGELVTHRIVEINPDGTFTTMGDANTAKDSLPVRAEQILGKYTKKSRFFKWINSFADMKKLIALFVIIPLTLIALYEAKTVLKLSVQVKRENDEEYELRKQELIREAIEKEKQRLAEEASGADKEKIDEPRTNNEKEND